MHRLILRSVAACLLLAHFLYAEDGMCLVVTNYDYMGDYTVGNIRRIDMRAGAVVNTTGTIGYGCFPRFSPDGRQFAFINGNTVTIANIDGGVVRTFDAAGNGNLTWGNTGIWICANGQFYKYAVADGHLLLTKSFTHCERGQVSRNEITGGGVWTQDWHPTIYSFGRGTTVDVPKPAPVNGVQFWVAGCSVCPSPSGTRLTNNMSSVGEPPNIRVYGHTNMRILDTLGNESLRLNLQTITGLGTDRFWNEQTWSGNSDDWIVLPIGRTNDLNNPCLTNSNEPWIYNLTTHEIHQLANRTSDIWQPYDYYSGYCPGSTTPVLQVSPTSLTFAVDSGSVNPPSQNVTASTANGILQSLAVSGANAWLTVTPGATSGASITIVNAPSIAGLRSGTYLDTITVNTSNAGSKTYAVTLTVRKPAVTAALTTMSITPAQFTVAAGSPVTFLATCKDQNGNYFANAIKSWSVSGGGTIDQTGKFIAAAAPCNGPHRVIGTVASGSVTLRDTAWIMVSRKDCVYRKIDAGANSYCPAGWETDDAYVSGGSDVNNAAAVSVAGVAAAAPANVYASARRGSAHSYRVSHLDQGFYTVRMHFADAKDTARLMSYTIQGINILRDFSISSLAGGANKALALDFVTQIQDTNGLSISCSGANGSDVFESGIEIMQHMLTPITLVSPIGGEKFTIGQTMQIRWYTDTLQTNQVYVDLSVDGGRNYLQIGGGEGVMFVDNRGVWGTFNWAIPDSVADNDGKNFSTISTRCRIRLSPYFGTVGIAAVSSDSAFTIAARSMVVTDRKSRGPRGRTVWVCGQPIRISSESPGQIEVFTVTGARVYSWRDRGPRDLVAPKPAENAALIVRVTGVDGTQIVRTISVDR